MLDTVKINHVQHISFTQSRLTDAVSVILSELLSYEHPSNVRGFLHSGLWKVICTSALLPPELFPKTPLRQAAAQTKKAAYLLLLLVRAIIVACFANGAFHRQFDNEIHDKQAKDPINQTEQTANSQSSDTHMYSYLLILQPTVCGAVSGSPAVLCRPQHCPPSSASAI